MDRTICGHERDALLFALNAATPANKNPTTHSAANWKRVFDNYCPRQIHVDPGTRMLTRGTKRTDSEALGLASGYADAWFAIHDPAKLAEMLAERGRELGLGVDVCEEFEMFRGQKWPMLKFDDAEYAFRLVTRDMATWRAILLQWLQLPDVPRDASKGDEFGQCDVCGDGIDPPNDVDDLALSAWESDHPGEQVSLCKFGTRWLCVPCLSDAVRKQAEKALRGEP